LQTDKHIDKQTDTFITILRFCTGGRIKYILARWILERAYAFKLRNIIIFYSGV